MVQELAVEDCQKFLRNFMYCNSSRNRNRKLAPEATQSGFNRLNVGAISNSDRQSESASASVQCSCIFLYFLGERSVAPLVAIFFLKKTEENWGENKVQLRGWAQGEIFNKTTATNQ